MQQKKILHRVDHKLAEPEWYKLVPLDLAQKLATDLKRGLSSSEAKRRYEVYGPNTLPKEEEDSYLAILLRQVRSPLVYILLFAAFLSLSLQNYTDLAIVLAVIVINIFLGFLQEHRASRTLTELQKVIKYKAVVIRDGVVTEVESHSLVPGDIVRISAGDKVPADARIFEASSLEIVEAALTGESIPSLKSARALDAETPVADQENMIFMGTLVTGGSGWAVVVATGSSTQVGRIAVMLAKTTKALTPLQQQLVVFSRWTVVLTLAFSFMILVIGILQRRDFFDMLTTAVAVAVAAIPEGLLISLTVILAVGMRRILQKRGLVRHLSSAETLGATSVICTDKTGTLTLGEMRVTSLVTSDEEFHHGRSAGMKSGSHLLRLLRYALLASDALVENPEEDPHDWRVLGNQTERALLVAGGEMDVKKNLLDQDYPVQERLPFSEKTKFTAVLRTTPAGARVYAKGAAEIVLGLCERVEVAGNEVRLDARSRARLEQKINQMTSEGLRVLGIAHGAGKGFDFQNRPVLQKLAFVGFIGLRDPLREEVKATLAQAYSAGLRPVIITGDHPNTVRVVARDLGLEASAEEIKEGKDLDRMDDDSLLAAVERIKIYARVTPAHKLRIIDAWQKRGHVVAMTGDGVNDAPALKKADIGMSLGSGTEVAKQASDLVLLDNDFRTIVSAIEQGRIIFDNIRRVIVYLLSDSFVHVVLIAGSMFLGLPLPLLPAQILWSNLVTDGPPNLALTLEPGDGDALKHPPRAKGTPLIDREVKFLILFVGVFTDLIFLALYFKLYTQYSLDLVRSAAFAAVGFSSLLYAFSLKNLRKPLWKARIFDNPWLLLAVAISALLQLSAIYLPPLQILLHTVPLPAVLWGWVIVLSLIKLVAIELAKLYFRLSLKYQETDTCLVI